MEHPAFLGSKSDVYQWERVRELTNSEEDIVEKEKRNRSRGHGFLAGISRLLTIPQQCCNDRVAEALSSSREHQQFSPAPTFDIWYRYETEYKV